MKRNAMFIVISATMAPIKYKSQKTNFIGSEDEYRKVKQYMQKKLEWLDDR
jgi:hypothetical protein